MHNSARAQQVGLKVLNIDSGGSVLAEHACSTRFPGGGVFWELIFRETHCRVSRHVNFVFNQ
jgi:hypothetical protein